MRVIWWLVCLIISPFVLLFDDAKLEQLLAKATLKPRNEIDAASDAFNQTKGNEHEHFSDQEGYVCDRQEG